MVLIVLIVISIARLIKYFPEQHLTKMVDVEFARSSTNPVTPEEDDGYDEISYEDHNNHDDDSSDENENDSLTSNEENLFRLPQPIGNASPLQRPDSFESGNVRDSEQRLNINS